MDIVSESTKMMDFDRPFYKMFIKVCIIGHFFLNCPSKSVINEQFFKKLFLSYNFRQVRQSSSALSI